MNTNHGAEATVVQHKHKKYIHNKKDILLLCKKYKRYKNIITAISHQENIDYGYVKLLFDSYGIKENKKGRIFMAQNSSGKQDKPSIDFESFEELIILENKSKQQICQLYNINIATADYWLKCIIDNVTPKEEIKSTNVKIINPDSQRTTLTLSNTPSKQLPKSLDDDPIVNALMNKEIKQAIKKLDNTTDISPPKCKISIPKPPLKNPVIFTPTDFLKSHVKKTDSQKVIPKPLENRIPLPGKHTDISIKIEEKIDPNQSHGVIKESPHNNEIKINKSVNEIVDSLFADFDFVEEDEKLTQLDSFKNEEKENKSQENNDLEVNLLIQEIENDVFNINSKLERLKKIIKYK